VVTAWAVAWWFTGGGKVRASSSGNTLGNPPGMVDRLLFVESAEGWSAGAEENAEVVTTSPSVVRMRDGERKDYPRMGRWTSPVYEVGRGPAGLGMPFTELIPSFNADAPPETGLRLDVRVRDRRSGEWSPWLYLGSWGRTPAKAPRVVSLPRGVVHVDYLTLDRPADAVQARVEFYSFSMDSHLTPALRRLSLAYSGVVDDLQERARLRPATPVEGTWARDLGVPFRTQKDAPAALRGEICSPTSVTMVLAYWGVDRPVVENALAIYDPESEIFGHWGRAVQRAAALGLDGWVARFRDWDSVKAQVARGQPVIASVRFKKGEFPSAVLSQTNGHLIVVRGFTPEGDVIVNDPASRDRGNGAVYKASELASAWFDHGGVGYVIAGRSPAGQGAKPGNVGATSQPTTSRVALYRN
jgi:hypothetical protein